MNGIEWSRFWGLPVMSQSSEVIDITHLPDIRRLAEEVRGSQAPRRLRVNDEEVAMLVPLWSEEDQDDEDVKNWTPTEEQRQAVLAAAGSWEGLVDVDQLKAQIKAARGSHRPPVKL